LAVFTKAIFLDRDGVLNEALIRDGKPFSPMTIAQVVVPPDVPGALSRLRQNGFHLIMVTNQPDIARGSQSRETVHAINQFANMTMPIIAIAANRSLECCCVRPIAIT
jgi:D-glycero-D-manno-heptose 1,7-bisphosphate phosphatase